MAEGFGLERALELFWHPVATLEEVANAAPNPLAITLLGRQLAVADIGDRVVTLIDRCPHRSTRLSIGTAENGGIRCAYHGWRFNADGQCTEIPSTPQGPIPQRACVRTFDTTTAYGLVWVRLDDRAGTQLPACPVYDEPTMRILAGWPYTWPTSAARRVENFVDIAHFAWVHDGTLGRRDQPVPQVPEVRREAGELRFEYTPPDQDVEVTAMFGASRYRMPMPLTVDIEFTLATGGRRRLWMTASPVDSRSCRSFWLLGRDDDLDPARDADHLAFQQVVLDQDEPVVCAQDPPGLPLDAGVELSVRTDRVSIEYRRWLRELADAAQSDPDRVREVLTDQVPTAVA
jgi:vanillate O-demethylase monooxygenase subunit